MSPLSRRTFLRLSVEAGLASAVPGWLWAQQEKPKAKAVIWLWMGGGPSQIDTWDPKPGSPNQGEFKAIPTAVPGIEVSELLPLCASQMKHLAIVRSMVTQAGTHDAAVVAMHTGVLPNCAPEDPAMGTVVAYEIGRKGDPLPAFIAIDPPAIPESDVFGEDCLPLRLRSPEDPIPNVRRRVAGPRAKARGDLLKAQNGEWEANRLQGEVARIQAQGVRVEETLDSPALKAFDLSGEPEALRKAYGGRFGQNCLLARRLVQAGCAFVEVGLHGWDTHEDNFTRVRKLCAELDPGMGTLIRDLAEKDLLKHTLVVWAGEFGRSPEINAKQGRDHWTKGFSVVLAGGPIRGGQVYGDTGKDGTECKKPVLPYTLFATVYKACGIDYEKKYESVRKVKYASVNGNSASSVSFLKELF